MIRIFQGAQLSLQKDLFALFESVPQEKRNIAHIGFYHFSVFLQFRHDLVRVQKRFVIEMLKKNILGLADTFHFFSQFIFKEQFVYLETDLGIFIRIEGSDAGLGGSEGFAAQTLFLILIEQDMIGHYDLRPVGDHDLRRGNSPVYDILIFLKEHRNI